MKKFFTYLPSLPKTAIFNFYYFPFATAWKFPVFVCWRVRLKNLKGAVTLHEVRTGIIRLGFGNDGARTVWDNTGHIVFRGVASLREGCHIRVSGHLDIGTEFTINPESMIVATKDIQIGRKALVSAQVMIIDNDFHDIFDETGAKINPAEGIEIADRVWIGYRAMILKGTKISEQTVVAAGSIVVKTIEQKNVIVAGAPARVMRENITWRR